MTSNKSYAKSPLFTVVRTQLYSLRMVLILFGVGLFCLPLLIYALMLGIMIFSGIRGNRMYMKHCVRTVQEIKRTSQNESDAAVAYSALGGVNTAAAFCLLGCYLITQWIPLFFI